MRPGRSGTSYDGSTIKRLFRDAKKSARITRLNKKLIDRLRVILQTLACGCAIHSDAYGVYAHETVTTSVEKLPRYQNVSFCP